MAPAILREPSTGIILKQNKQKEQCQGTDVHSTTKNKLSVRAQQRYHLMLRFVLCTTTNAFLKMLAGLTRTRLAYKHKTRQKQSQRCRRKFDLANKSLFLTHATVHRLDTFSSYTGAERTFDATSLWNAWSIRSSAEISTSVSGLNGKCFAVTEAGTRNHGVRVVLTVAVSWASILCSDIAAGQALLGGAGLASRDLADGVLI
eukprot:6175749-Pleurochrysis_carterae.AAC.4